MSKVKDNSGCLIVFLLLTLIVFASAKYYFYAPWRQETSKLACNGCQGMPYPQPYTASLAYLTEDDEWAFIDKEITYLEFLSPTKYTVWVVRIFYGDLARERAYICFGEPKVVNNILSFISGYDKTEHKFHDISYQIHTLACPESMTTENRLKMEYMNKCKGLVEKCPIHNSKSGDGR